MHQIYPHSTKMKEMLRKEKEREDRKLFRASKTHCDICKKKLEGGKKSHMDHCHQSGAIRGMLCSSCNWGLGHFKDNYEVLLEAAKYVVKHRILNEI